MQYQVPQFIDVEDKIFGPFTFKQFVYIIGGLGLSYIIYRFTPSIWISGLPIVLVLTLSGTLAFYRVNNRPFINVLESAFRYSVASKLYLWKKDDKKQAAQAKAQQKAAAAKNTTTPGGGAQYARVMVPRVSESKLKDLAWNLDIQERINMGEVGRK